MKRAFNFDTFKGANDATSNQTSAESNVLYIDNVSIQIGTTGSFNALATLQIQYSNDGDNWVNGPAATTLTSNPQLIEFKDITAAKVRFVFTSASSTGILSGWVTGKEK